MGTQLTQEERQVLELAAYGRTTKEIAAEMGSSPDDVRRHLHSIFTKLDDSRAA